MVVKLAFASSALSPEQPSKASSLMVVRLSGRTISSREGNQRKARMGMAVTPSSTVIFFSEAQPSKGEE